MKLRHKILIAIVSIWLLAHFALTTIYATDFFVLPRPVRAVSQGYTVPFFHQSWTMFAPEVPEYDMHLKYRYYHQQWSAWRDVSEANGFNTRHRMEYVEQNILSGLSRQIADNFYYKDKKPVFDDVMKSFDYNKTIYFVITLHQSRSIEVLGDSVQIAIDFTFTNPPQSLATERTGHLEFPAFSLIGSK
ncbi:MAG: DUF5819 family protein [Flavobacteriales bacterium]